MNKIGNIKKTTQIIMGVVLGATGLIVTTAGAVTEQISLMRIGVVLTTFGVWAIQWN